MKGKNTVIKILKIFLYNLLIFAVLIGGLFFYVTAPDDTDESQPNVINDVTGLNPVMVAYIKKPVSVEEIMGLVKNHPGPISVGGGRFSMGGQTATEQTLQLDMRSFDKVLAFSKEKKEITVQPGITWRKIQEYIDPHNLSVKIMQTYANFTVGGSLSVNVHGRYIGYGPLIYSVKSFKIVLPDGTLMLAAPDLNQEIFYGAIGGYGAFGVIVEVTLSLADNVKVERRSELMSLGDYKEYFFKKIREDSSVIFHNANIYPGSYDRIRAVSYVKTDKELTVQERLQNWDQSYRMERFAMWMVSEMPFGKWIRENWIDPVHFSGEEVEWRNYEASYNVKELEPASRKNSTYVLQEYFVPVEKIDSFVPRMGEIFNRHDANIINVSIRHAKKDPGTLLAWARNEVFAFVVYYKQGTAEHEKKAVAVWTRELIDAASSLGGAYYLPYQIHATDDQFRSAYPNANLFFALKKKIDPQNKFRNKLWDAYYRPENDTLKTQTPRPVPRQVGIDTTVRSRFKSVLADKRKSDGIYLFLQNVYGLYPPDEFHNLVMQKTSQYKTDKEIYEAIQKDISSVTPVLWSFRYALPALKKQKAEIARQTAELVGKGATVNGYLEIGSTGRYVNALADVLDMKGPVYMSYYETPNYGLQDMMERGQISQAGKFFDLNNYDPIPVAEVPDSSLDLVTVYIGLHHAPDEKLDAYIRSLWRVLRPGGKLVIRDHNVTSPEFSQFVSLVHDVFYCGLDETWDYTNGEIRNFTASDSLSAYLEARGFKADSRRLLQANDPSLNTLMMFTKISDVKTARATVLKDSVQHILTGIKDWQRDEAQTYLTLPEWFLVYSPDEYAQFIKSKKPSRFPYFGSVKQFWQYYGDVYDLTKERYAFNQGYHLMVFVIGTSYSLENIVKGIYEKTTGRISEWFRGDELTEEDRYAAKIAQDYVSFIRIDPWYEFNFSKALKELWADTDLFGKNFLRKWERKMILSNEYALKSCYAYLIKLGTKEVYGDAETQMLVVSSKTTPEKLSGLSGTKLVKKLNDSLDLISLPRYEAFREATVSLISRGVQYYAIAGNDEILITCIAPSDWIYTISSGSLVIERPILTLPDKKRIGIKVPVTSLHKIIPGLESQGIILEHVYDY